jgi:Tol biopolymer transport system component
MLPDGSGLTNLTNHPAHDVNPYWSPDGKRIAFMSDRTGFMQIFVMNADGSDVTQLTDNEANHEFSVSDHSPWSPDGSRLLFTEWAASNEKWMLYTVDMNGENKTPIAEVPNIYTSPSWSPDGQHIAFVIPAPQDGPQGREELHIRIRDASTNDLTDVTNLLPEDEDLFSSNYSWTPEGNIRFVAGRVYWENDNGKFAVYEATVDGATLAEIANTSTPLGDTWDGTTFVRGFGDTLTWLRPDGTYSEFKPFEKCEVGVESQYTSSYYKRSSRKYLLFGAGCPNGNWWFVWADPQGMQVKQLLNYPLASRNGFSNMVWSPDDKYIALNANSSDITYLYVLNIADALKDPSTQFVKIPLAGGEQYYNISWQPMP